MGRPGLRSERRRDPAAREEEEVRQQEKRRSGGGKKKRKNGKERRGTEEEEETRRRKQVKEKKNEKEIRRVSISDEMSVEEGNNPSTFDNNDKESRKRKARSRNRLNLNKSSKAREIGVRFNELGQSIGDAAVALIQMSVEEGTNPSTFDNNHKESRKRKARGRNILNLDKIAKAREIGVRFNELGQPIGDASVALSTSCGTIVTQLVPITYDSWLQVPQILKDSLWETVKSGFGLEDAHKQHVLSIMNGCWRRYKCKITKEIRNVPFGPAACHSLKLLKPDNIEDDEEWEKFVNFRRSAKFDEISGSMTTLAKKNTTPHTTSRKGLARLREDLITTKEVNNEDPAKVDRAALWIAGHMHKDGTPVNENVAQIIDQIKSISSNEITGVANDAVAQVLGTEHRGRVRGLGTGVTPSKVHATMGQQGSTQMNQMIKDLEQQVLELKSIVLNMQTSDRSRDGGVHSFEQNQGTQYSSASNGQGNYNRLKRIINSTYKSPLGVSTTETIDVQRKKCKLLHWLGTGEVVAEATIESTDPKTLVHHLPLGPDQWKVGVKKVVINNVPLYRPISQFKILEDTIGRYIAWPSKYISTS